MVMVEEMDVAQVFHLQFETKWLQRTNQELDLKEADVLVEVVLVLEVLTWEEVGICVAYGSQSDLQNQQPASAETY